LIVCFSSHVFLGQAFRPRPAVSGMEDMVKNCFSPSFLLSLCSLFFSLLLQGAGRGAPAARPPWGMGNAAGRGYDQYGPAYAAAAAAAGYYGYSEAMMGAMGCKHLPLTTVERYSPSFSLIIFRGP